MLRQAVTSFIFPLRMSLVSRGWHVAPTYCIRCRVRGANRHAAVPEGLSQSRRAAVVAVRGVAATCRTSLRCGTSSKPPGRSAWWCSVLHGRCLPVKRRLPAKLASLSHVGRSLHHQSLGRGQENYDSPFRQPSAASCSGERGLLGIIGRIVPPWQQSSSACLARLAVSARTQSDPVYHVGLGFPGCGILLRM